MKYCYVVTEKLGMEFIDKVEVKVIIYYMIIKL